MSDEWTMGTLLAHVEALIKAERDLREAREVADATAIAKAERTLSDRLEKMNEVRDQLTRQAATFLPRETFEASLGEWGAWRRTVDGQLSAGHGRSQGVSATWQQMAGLLAAASGVISIVIVAANYFTGGN